MALEQEIVVHFHEVDPDEDVKDLIEARCAEFAKEFPEAMKFEVSLLSEGDGFTAHAHVTGRKTNLAANHDWARELRLAADQVLDKLEARMRRHHDKMRTTGRRAAARRGEPASSGDSG